MIDITGIDLIEFVKKTYELSSPQGLGFLHAKDGGLTDEEAKSFINKKGDIAISMDYVHGRACKMNVLRKEGRLEIRDTWYDHTDSQLNKLLAHFNIKREGEGEHGCACNCEDCRVKQGKPRQKIGDFLDMTGISLDPKKNN